MIDELTWIAVQHAIAVGAGTLLLILCHIIAGYVPNCSGQHTGAGAGATTVWQIQDSLTAEEERRATAEYVGRHRLLRPR
ncbi:hypothetical protein [Saccharopolyspora pogona]|uniref:hypothetical protein n=1 Tax=Saccharopolyspora pogona TaxID=333966 RepID=UPI001688FDAB|nr:hypothetical protein [Saccharopolyspora pogona]